jgi:thiosulfate dehydrogenase [quinone] large subunit
MPENPLSDLTEFLTDRNWPTPIFWLLVVASVVIAVIVWRRRPAQRDFSHVAQWAFRFVMGGFWWQQTLWKLPPTFAQDPSNPLTTGLAYWMSQIGKYAAIPLQGHVFSDIVLPHFYVFAPIVYAAEVLVAVSLMLGLFTRAFAAFGALQILNLWLGLYNAPGEWPWTYFFLLVLQCMFAVHCYGRVLGLDALLLSSAARGSGSAGWGSRLVRAAS